MRYILKFIVGFSLVMVALLLFVVVVNYGWYVFYVAATLIAGYLCYSIGSDVWNAVELIYNDKGNE